MKVTDEMVNRFLAWRLPKPWHPDNGISYARPNYAHEPADHDWPTGTNLFDASQTRAMLEYVLDDRPMQPTYYVQHPDGTFSEADPQPVSANA